MRGNRPRVQSMPVSELVVNVGRVLAICNALESVKFGTR